MFWSECACAGPGQLKAAARAGVAGGRCSESVSRECCGAGRRAAETGCCSPPQPRHRRGAAAAAAAAAAVSE